jgi:hypothetical protein
MANMPSTVPLQRACEDCLLQCCLIHATLWTAGRIREVITWTHRRCGIACSIPTNCNNQLEHACCVQELYDCLLSWLFVWFDIASFDVVFMSMWLRFDESLNTTCICTLHCTLFEVMYSWFFTPLPCTNKFLRFDSIVLVFNSFYRLNDLPITKDDSSMHCRILLKYVACLKVYQWTHFQQIQNPLINNKWQW